MPCAYPYFLDILDMKKKSKYRIRKNELRRFEKENKLTKKEKERLHMWVDAGHSAYDLQWLYELREEEEFDKLLIYIYNMIQYLCISLPSFKTSFSNTPPLLIIDLTEPMLSLSQTNKTLSIPSFLHSSKAKLIILVA